ncbi:hypothetical protein OQA88_5088 [Cercophora sp. LCS_1]
MEEYPEGPEAGANTGGGDTLSSLWIVNLSNLKPPQYALLALFALYATSTMGHGFLFDPYLQLLLSVSLIFGSLLVSTTNLAGPLRYAYYGYDGLLAKAFSFASPIGTKVMGWAPLPFLVLAALPWFRTGFFTGIMPIAWQFVREEHLQEVGKVSNWLDKLCSKAKMDAENAVSDASVARQHERDLKQNLKDSAHYDESSVAWKTGPEFEKLARGEGRMAAWQGAGVPGGAVTERGVQSRETRTVASAVKAVTDDVLEAVNAAQESLKLLDEMQSKAVEANTLAKQGWMAKSAKLTEEVEKLSKQVEDEKDKAETAKEKAASYARDVYLTWLLVCEEHRRAISETENKVDGSSAQAEVAAIKARSDLGDAERYRNDLEQNLRAADFSNTSLIGQVTALGARAKRATDLVAEVDTWLGHVSKTVQGSAEAAGKTQILAAEAKTAAREGRRELVLKLEADVANALGTARKESDQAAARKEKVRTVAREAYRECQSVLEEHRREVKKVSNEAARRKLGDYHDYVTQAADGAWGLGEVARDLQSRAGHAMAIKNTATYLSSAVAARGGGVALGQLAEYASDLQSMAAMVLAPDKAATLKDVADKTENARHKLRGLERESERIRQDVEQFRKANEKAREGRAMQTEAAKGAAQTLKEVATDVAVAAEAARKAAEHAGEVRQSAVEAKAAAALGGAKGAEAAMNELDDALQACQEQLEIAVDKRKEVQAKMVQFARNMYLPGP